MKQLIQYLALAALLALCVSGQTAPGPVAPVTLYADYQQAMPQGVSEVVRAEVDSIMSPSGLRFDWQPLKDFREGTLSAALAVVHFEGRCDVSGLAMKGTQPGSLGWTETNNGTIFPFTHLDCERIRTFLQIKLLGFRPEERQRAFGRALGRVLAHELYHIFGDTPHHGAHGVAKEAYSVDELLAADFQFHEKETRLLRTSRALQVLKAAGSTF